MKNIPRFPTQVHPCKAAGFVSCIYIESSLEKHQSTSIIKTYEELHDEGLPGMFWYVQRSCVWELHTLSSPYICVRCINWCPVDGGVISTTLLWEQPGCTNSSGKSCFRILQLLELHLQVISCIILILLLVEINVADRYIFNLTFLQLSRWKYWWQEEVPCLASRNKYFVEESFFQKSQSAAISLQSWSGSVITSFRDFQCSLKLTWDR